jgi:hypothetical protein
MGDRPPLILTLKLGRETFKRGLSPIIPIYLRSENWSLNIILAKNHDCLGL